MNVLEPLFEVLELLEVPLELPLELLVLPSDVSEFVDVTGDRELLTVPINDSRAGQDWKSHPAREG